MIALEQELYIYLVFVKSREKKEEEKHTLAIKILSSNITQRLKARCPKSTAKTSDSECALQHSSLLPTSTSTSKMKQADATAVERLGVER
jgi:hypothetical protein